MLFQTFCHQMVVVLNRKGRLSRFLQILQLKFLVNNLILLLLLFFVDSCACLPDFCKPVKCPDGQRLKVIVHGDNRPGSCCTLFHCIRGCMSCLYCLSTFMLKDKLVASTSLYHIWTYLEGEQTCLYEGEEYVEGSVWKVDKCTTCSCKNNITFCNSVECNITSYCGRMEVPEGECCPVCTGKDISSVIGPSGFLGPWTTPASLATLKWFSYLNSWDIE